MTAARALTPAAAARRQDARGHVRHRLRPARHRLRVVSVSVSDQVRQSVTANLESSQRMFAALETRRQHELVAQAVDARREPDAEGGARHLSDRSAHQQRRGQGAAARDHRRRAAEGRGAASRPTRWCSSTCSRTTIAAAGRMGERFPRGRPVALSGGDGAARFDGIARIGGGAFRVVAVPLQFSDGTIVGTLYLATSLDAAYAEELARLAGTQTAILSDGLMLASTLPPGAAREFEAAVAAAGPTPARSSLERRVATRSAGSSRSATRRSTRSARSTTRRAARCARRCATCWLHRGRRDGAGAARQHHAGAAAVASDRPAVDLARSGWRRRTTSRSPLPLDRLEPRARRADRDLQRSDGLGRAGRGATPSRLHRRDPRARDRARRARSVHRRPLRSRQRALGRDRPHACRCPPTISKCCGSARCSTTSARSACPTMCCASRGR